MFCHRETRQRDAQPVTGRLVHLAEHHGHFIEHAGFFHFMEEVIPLTGPLTHAGKHGEPRVLFRDVVDEFHDGHGLAHTRATEQADFAAFGDRHNEVDDLNAGFEDVDRR